jgi:alpha-L-fucosidase
MMTRRDFLITTAIAGQGLTMPRRSLARRREAPALQPRPLPSTAQLAWQRDELALFLHFGVNTFTDREWGDGKEDPAIDRFAPTAVRRVKVVVEDAVAPPRPIALKLFAG